MPKTAPPKTAPPTFRDDIDELGLLEAEGVSKKYARMKVLRDRLTQTIAEDSGEVTLHGHTHAARIGPRGPRRFIKSMAKVFALLKRDVFLENCSLTLEKFELLVPEEKQPGLIGSANTGPRSVVTFPLAATFMRDSKAA